MDTANRIDVRPAAVHQADDALSVLSEAATWLPAQGINQWPAPFPDKLVLPALLRDETYLAYIEGQLAGTLTIQQSDPTLTGHGGARWYWGRSR